jgi:hypothetical protein
MGCEVVTLSIDANGTNPLRDLSGQYRHKCWLSRCRPHVLFSFTVSADMS